MLILSTASFARTHKSRAALLARSLSHSRSHLFIISVITSTPNKVAHRPYPPLYVTAAWAVGLE